MRICNEATVLFIPCMCGDNGDWVVLFQLLLDNGADVTMLNEDNWTPLMVIVCRENFSMSRIQIVKLLLRYGCDVNAQSKTKWTALMLICRYCLNKDGIEIVKLLLGYSCDINAQNNNGWTALMLVCRYCFDEQFIEIVSLLLDRGCDWNIRNNNGKTAFYMLGNNSSYVALGVVELFVSRGYDWKQEKDLFVTSCFYNRSVAKWMLDRRYEMNEYEKRKFKESMMIVIDYEDRIC